MERVEEIVVVAQQEPEVAEEHQLPLKVARVEQTAHSL
jgi:hypothetical protein